jgi:hypothetical protein
VNRTSRPIDRPLQPGVQGGRRDRVPQHLDRRAGDRRREEEHLAGRRSHVVDACADEVLLQAPRDRQPLSRHALIAPLPGSCDLQGVEGIAPAQFDQPLDVGFRQCDARPVSNDDADLVRAERVHVERPEPLRVHRVGEAQRGRFPGRRAAHEDADRFGRQSSQGEREDARGRGIEPRHVVDRDDRRSLRRRRSDDAQRCHGRSTWIGRISARAPPQERHLDRLALGIRQRLEEGVGVGREQVAERDEGQLRIGPGRSAAHDPVVAASGILDGSSP